MKTVLIVEDEKMIRKGIKTMVERSGVPVEVIIECKNGLMALDILKNQRIDVMFTDIRMPKMDGIELVREIQKLKHKPFIVAISGYDDFSYAVELMRMGVREYLLKPVERDKVKEILEKFNKEITESREKDSEIRTIFYRQLKLVMLNHNVSLKEIEVMAKEHTYLFNNEYVVCCIPKSDGTDYESSQYIYLNDIDKSDVIIVSSENIDYLLRGELKGKYVGISSPYINLEKLSTAYNEAFFARQVAFINSEENVEYEEGIIARNSEETESETDEDIISLAEVEGIAQMLGTDKYKTAIKQVEMLKYNTIRKKYSVELSYKALMVLINKISNLYQRVLDIEESILNNFKNPLNYDNIDDYFEDLLSWLTKTGYEINSQFDDYKNKSKVHKAIKYINENYNKDLNMAVVSNYISMNYSLFSQSFKQYTGSNFVDYLKKLRINEAKRLLEETDLRINEVSYKVGYNNEKHFMKIFKNTTGVSPSQYRKNTQLKKNI